MATGAVGQIPSTLQHLQQLPSRRPTRSVRGTTLKRVLLALFHTGVPHLCPLPVTLTLTFLQSTAQSPHIKPKRCKRARKPTQPFKVPQQPDVRAQGTKPQFTGYIPGFETPWCKRRRSLGGTAEATARAEKTRKVVRCEEVSMGCQRTSLNVPVPLLRPSKVSPPPWGASVPP
eukprot:355252-Chlamydomonas_euryale.AAC.3